MIEKAITDLYNDKLFISMCKRYGKENSDDLKQIVILLLLEKPKNILEHIIKSDYLLPYSLQMIRFQTSSVNNGNGTEFNKKFFDNKKIVLTNELPEIEHELPDEDYFILAEKVSAKVLNDALDQKNEHFYHAMLVKLKVKYKNVKQLSKATKIPYRSMLYALDEYKKYLAEWSAKEQ